MGSDARVGKSILILTLLLSIFISACDDGPNGNCHPSYEGVCLPANAADVDCRGGRGDGPVYTSAKDFRVVGPDDYELDGDDDGIACE